MSTTMREGLNAYFERMGLGPQTYEDPWVPYAIGPVELTVPNTRANVEATRVHDLHHVLTGYAADTVGEIEIAAWEVGSGTAASPHAFVIDHALVALGMALAPRRTLAALARGRRCDNLYGSPLAADVAAGRPDAALLDQPIDEVARELGTAAPPPQPAGADVLALVGAACVGAVMGALMVPALPVFAVVRRATALSPAPSGL